MNTYEELMLMRNDRCNEKLCECESVLTIEQYDERYDRYHKMIFRQQNFLSTKMRRPIACFTGICVYQDSSTSSARFKQHNCRKDTLECVLFNDSVSLVSAVTYPTAINIQENSKN